MAIVGIDLGTTASLVAYHDGERPVLIESRDGGIRGRFHWSYVLWTVADEAVLAFPLWIDRMYTLKT